MSNEALISDLASALTPVRRRSAWREAALVAGLGAVELTLFLALGAMRPDMGTLIGTPYMIWKLVSLALVAGVSGVTAIVSLSPTASPRNGLLIAFAVAVLACMAGLFVPPAPGGMETYGHVIAHAYGPLCALSIVVLSLPMLGILAVLMRRGAPSHPERTALAAGMAAGSWGALVFAFCCPAGDPLYVVIWYAAGCALVGAAARLLLGRAFRL